MILQFLLYLKTSLVSVDITFQTTFLLEFCFAGSDPGFPVGGDVDPFRGDMDLCNGHFSVKMCVKTKELGPVGGRAPENFVCRSANVKFVS